MKTLNGLICLSILLLISGCLPDSFTKWNLEPPSTASSGDGATDGGGTGSGATPPAPTNFTYTPEGPYAFNLTADASGTIPEITPISTAGGEIVEGYITFQLASVTDINGNPATTVWPNSLTMDSNTGIISGRPNQFINHNIYKIKATPLGQAPIYTNIEISMATQPGTIFYPQVTGQTLLLEVSKPENFKVGNWVTSEKNAKGSVSSVDQANKIIYITVSCASSSCPIFKKDDKIDNKNGYFLEQSIVSKVVYGFEKATGIPTTMIPVNNPNLNGQAPQYAISPDITVNNGVGFSTSTGQIFAAPCPATCSALADIPNTQYTVTVKNVIGQTANAILNIQLLDVSNPKSPDSLEYAYTSGNRVVLTVENTNMFLVGGEVSNQNNTRGSIRDNIQSTTFAPVATPGELIIDIFSNSKSPFKMGEQIDNGYPYVLAATKIDDKVEPFRVHEIGTPFSASPTLTGNLSASDLNTLTWTSNPELPHLCQSISTNPTTYYIEETNVPSNPASCENAHGSCSITSYNNGVACVTNSATWTTTAKFLTEYKDELWFNRRTGKFGADNPKKTFPSQSFEVTVTSLTGVVLKTTTSFSFQDVPKNLSYASDVLLEVDDYSAFDIGDQITSDGTGVGIVTYKFFSSPQIPTPTYVSSQKILVVRATAGQFLDGEDIDNVYPFTFQKGEILKAKYNNLGINVNSNIGNFKVGDEVLSLGARGIVNYIENTAVSASNTMNALWVRLIDTTIPLVSFTTNSTPAITAQPSGATSNIGGIVGTNISLNQPTAGNYTAGMDVTANTVGFGMTNSGGNDVSISVEQGKFSVGSGLFRYNPSISTAPGQASNLINSVTHNPIFYLDRYSTSGIQTVVDSPPDNGVKYSITPALPNGLTFDTDTGQITTADPGPVAAALKNYTVVASNFLGQTSFSFGLGVREVFSVTDITNETGNLSGILHKSGQGYSRFPCRVTQDQIKMRDPNTAPRAKNINCIYDVGEGELYENGLELQVNVGKDLCVFVEHVPYFFYQQEYIKTTTTVQNMEHTGDWAAVSCGPGQPTGVPVQYPNGDAASKCVGNQQGVQCDDGTVPTIQRDYDLSGICYDSAGVPVALVADLATCYGNPAAAGGGANRAQCSDGTVKTRTQCLDANLAWNSTHAFINNQCWQIDFRYTDAVSCQDNIGTCSVPGNIDRTACQGATGTWTPSGRYVDRANCVGSAGAAGPPFSCGGEQINCINGPGKGVIPDAKLTGRFGSNLRGQTTLVGDDPITFVYVSAASLEYTTNLYLSNFSRTNSCTPYNGNPYEYDMSTWFNVGKNRNPTTQGANAPFAGGNGVYAIRCLDKSANIIAQLNILVREWDLDFKAKDGTDLMNLSGTPLDGGVPPDEFGYPQNTYQDWDNKTTGGPTCSSPTYTYPGSGL